jgi:hypothetical protein
MLRGFFLLLIFDMPLLELSPTNRDVRRIHGIPELVGDNSNKGENIILLYRKDLYATGFVLTLSKTRVAAFVGVVSNKSLC